MPDIRNIAIVGPSRSGKTTLVESILFAAGAIGRKGTVKDGSTVGDSAPEARERHMSTEVSAAHATFEGVALNIIDCTGSIKFFAETRKALVGVDAAIVVYEHVIEQAAALGPIFKFLKQNTIPTMVFINKMDRTATLTRDLLPAIQDVAETPLLITQVPIRDGEHVVGYVDLITEKTYEYKPGTPSDVIEMPDSVGDREDEVRSLMLETLADFDDTSMEKLLEDEVPSVDEFVKDLRIAFGRGKISPVLIGAAELENGMRQLMQKIVDWTPAPPARAEHHDLDDPPAAQVMKTFNTQHGGKVSLVQVWRGTIRDGDTVNGERIGGVYRMLGIHQDEVDHADAVDIVAFARLEHARTGDTLVAGSDAPDEAGSYPRAEPMPHLYDLAIHAAERDDEVKMATALQHIHDEDPSIHPEQDSDLHQLILWGQGDMHLQVSFAKLRDR